MRWSDETVDAIAQQFYNHVQDCCYTNSMGVVDGIMNADDFMTAARNSLAAVAQSKEVRDLVEAADTAIKEAVADDMDDWYANLKDKLKPFAEASDGKQQ